MNEENIKKQRFVFSSKGFNTTSLVLILLILLVSLVVYDNTVNHDQNPKNNSSDLSKAKDGQTKLQQNPTEALNAAKDKVLNNPSFSTYLALGLQYYQAKEFEKSVKANLKAIEYNNNNASAYNNLCCAYNELGKWEEAITACNKALELNPEFKLAKNNLNWAQTIRDQQQ